jgi:uncharacterized protein YdeI (YjbR/CyaY-like superfamily)
MNPRVDEYIERSEDFAKPILKHLRELVHKASPEITEEIKWGFPNFVKNGIICSMASFKKHCAFTIFNATMMNDPHGILKRVGNTSMGQLGRISDVSDLPSDDILLEYIKEAISLDKSGIRKVKPKETKEINIPESITEALETNPKAKATFINFSYSHKKEYLEWITDAKTEATREKRIATMLEWLEEGKHRNWKYEK